MRKQHLFTTEDLASRAARVLKDPEQTIVPPEVARTVSTLIDDLTAARKAHGAPPHGWAHIRPLALAVLEAADAEPVRIPQGKHIPADVVAALDAPVPAHG